MARPGGDRERVARQRARLVDVAGGGDPLHQLARAAVRGGGQPAADHLAHHGQVGANAVELLGAAAGDAEAGDHLVADEQRVVAVGELAEELEEALGGRDEAHVGRDRLAEDRRRLVHVQACSTASRSFQGTITVSSAASGGTPGLAGIDCVARPEPASASRPSTWPW